MLTHTLSHTHPKHSHSCACAHARTLTLLRFLANSSKSSTLAAKHALDEPATAASAAAAMPKNRLNEEPVALRCDGWHGVASVVFDPMFRLPFPVFAF